MAEHFEGDGCGYEHVDVSSLADPEPKLVAGAPLTDATTWRFARGQTLMVTVVEDETPTRIVRVLGVEDLGDGWRITIEPFEKGDGRG